MSVIISQTVIYCTVIQFGIDSFSGMERMKTINRTGVIFLLACVCCFLWGSASPSIKTGYELFQIAESDTWSIILFAGIRFFLAGLLVILFESIKEKRVVLPEKGSGKAIVILSLAQTILQYFFFYLGLAHTSGVTGTILSGTGGFLSIIMAACIFRLEKITVNKTEASITLSDFGAFKKRNLQAALDKNRGKVIIGMANRPKLNFVKEGDTGTQTLKKMRDFLLTAAQEEKDN